MPVRYPPDADEAAFRDVARRCLRAELPPDKWLRYRRTEPSLLPPLPDSARQPPPITVPRAYCRTAARCRSAIARRTGSRSSTTCCGASRRRTRARHARRRSRGRAAQRLCPQRAPRHPQDACILALPRRTSIDGATFYTAWFEPQHHILRRAVPFFVDRFAGMDWLIATPDRHRAVAGRHARLTARLRRTATSHRRHVLDELWLTYYRTTFNPARVRVQGDDGRDAEALLARTCRRPRSFPA